MNLRYASEKLGQLKQEQEGEGKIKYANGVRGGGRR